jgi:hypothetical protein
MEFTLDKVGNFYSVAMHCAVTFRFLLIYLIAPADALFLSARLTIIHLI